MSVLIMATSSNSGDCPKIGWMHAVTCNITHNEMARG